MLDKKKKNRRVQRVRASSVAYYFDTVSFVSCSFLPVVVGNLGRVRAEGGRFIAHDIRSRCVRQGRAAEYRGQYKELYETRPDPFS